MPDARDTDPGLGPPQFPTTRWSLLQGSRDPSSPLLEKAFENLATTYWRPICAYIRCSGTRSVEDARDLTQDFLVWVLESGFLRKADRNRGRFRAFVKVALSQFLIDRHRRKDTWKRGGRSRVIALDALQPESEEADVVDPRSASPDDALDQAWRRDVMQRGIEELERALAAEGKSVYYRVFSAHYFADGESAKYDAIARSLGIATTDVSNHLMHARRRFRQILKRIVSDTVLSRNDLDHEMKWLQEEEP